MPRRRKIHRVEQLDSSGCAISCVAMLTSTSYEEIRRAAFPRSWDYRRDFCLTDDQIIKLLKKQGVVARFKKNVRLCDFPRKRMILIHEFGDGTSDSHCVVRDENGKIYDPGWQFRPDYVLKKWMNTGRMAIICK